MEILGIGASELIFILLIAIIVLGPKDMQKAGKTIGRWLNHLVRSDSWKVFQKTSAELRNLPRNLMREANMEVAEMEKDLRNAIDPRVDPASRHGARRNPPAAPAAKQPTEETDPDKNE
jgi:sec-independent protein translocase protein TatB